MNNDDIVRSNKPSDIVDEEFIYEYGQFCHYVAECNALIIADQPNTVDRVHDLIALTSGMAMGFAQRFGILKSTYDNNMYNHRKPSVGRIRPTIPNEQSKPWEKIGISRTTWYRDQRRMRENEYNDIMNKLNNTNNK